jgi:lysophospholipase L1-like esterase
MPASGRAAPSTAAEWVFHGISLIGLLLIIGLGLELYARAVVDDGMQFDLEMWKYAVKLKQMSDDPSIGHEHRPLSAAHLMGVDMRINAKKLRDREFSYGRNAGTPRILMLGDSFTLGWGVAAEDTFSKRIEQLYAQSGASAEVINAGVGNYNTIQEVSYFLTEGYRFAPDIVVLNFDFNDAEPVPAYRHPGLLERHCYACVFLAGRVDALLRLLGLRPAWSDYYLNLYADGAGPGWRAARGALHRLAEFCRTRNIALVVFNLPELHDVRNYRLQAITVLIREAAGQEGVGFLDLLPAVAHEDPARLWVSPGDAHPNALAHRLFAEAMFVELRKRNGSAAPGGLD